MSMVGAGATRCPSRGPQPDSLTACRSTPCRISSPGRHLERDVARFVPILADAAGRLAGTASVVESAWTTLIIAMADRFQISDLLLQLLEDQGLRRRAIAARAGLARGFFEQERVLVTTRELFAVWRAVGELSSDPGIGLSIGAEPRLERYDAVAIAAVCSRSFGDALERMARFKQLLCPEELRIERHGDEAAVEFVFLEATDDEPEVLVDLCFARILAIGRRGSDQLSKALRVELKRPARERKLLEAHFGCRVRFGSERNALIFRKSDLDLPFVTHNRELLTAVLGHLEKQLEERTRGAGIGEQVVAALMRSLAGRRPTLGEVAEDLGMSTRTLQRRLGEAGLSFQQQVETARRELARHYLGETTVELKQAAFLLGYEDANSFFRAFQSWEGTTPGDWRARHQQLSV
ncbi:MAG: AraC family transcriptional regulator ligand-binding domain-containing protein [Planctomycetes bacterium]|nr:AraC family transcriptional regulator ligand-binding domain-containing protein [Planctomycetota bacterium]